MKANKFSLLFLFFSFLLPIAFAQLRIGFYRRSCPRAESIVRQVVQEQFVPDPSITAALLRMHFHDCFVKGCDASILIDSTSNRASEKSAGPNLSVRGYDLIDEVKRRLEAQCPSTVSCADVITLATRDSIAIAGGPFYFVPTGRRDGLVSDPAEVNLPGPTFSVADALKSFKAKKMGLNDMVTLLGAHTVGVSHCSFFQDRLSTFQGTGRPDPSMDPVLASSLKRSCAAPNDPTAFLDQNTSFVLDNQFYNQIRRKRGILELDQRLADDPSTRRLVSVFASNNAVFRRRFARAMVRLGSVEVLTGKAGEIRRNCRVFNTRR